MCFFRDTPKRQENWVYRFVYFVIWGFFSNIFTVWYKGELERFATTNTCNNDTLSSGGGGLCRRATRRLLKTNNCIMQRMELLSMLKLKSNTLIWGSRILPEIWPHNMPFLRRCMAYLDPYKIIKSLIIGIWTRWLYCIMLRRDFSKDILPQELTWVG